MSRELSYITYTLEQILMNKPVQGENYSIYNIYKALMTVQAPK